MRILRLEDHDLAPLLDLVLEAGGRLAVRVGGQSMRPAIRAGDVLTVGALGKEPVLYQVVITKRGGKLLAHRVCALERDGIVTWGDGCDHPDSPCLRTQVVAAVYAVYRPSFLRRLIWAIADRLQRIIGRMTKACSLHARSSGAARARMPGQTG